MTLGVVLWGGEEPGNGGDCCGWTWRVTRIGRLEYKGSGNHHGISRVILFIFRPNYPNSKNHVFYSRRVEFWCITNVPRPNVVPSNKPLSQTSCTERVFGITPKVKK